jgi:urease accessory protein
MQHIRSAERGRACPANLAHELDWGDFSLPVRGVEPPRLQRIEASGRITVCADHGAGRLKRLYQEGAAKIRLPRLPGPAVEAILINTGGGLTGGDRLEWEVAAESGSSLVVTTQACEKVYRAAEGHALVECRLSAGKGAFLAWLPQETILFDKAALRRRLEVDLEPGASALIVEAVIFGREAMGETISQASFHDRWRVRVNGRLLHAEDLALEGNFSELLARRAIASEARAMATVLLVGEGAEEKMPLVAPLLAPTDGASNWRVGDTGKLLARILARDGYALRQRLMPLLRLLAGEAGLPKIWSS